MAVTNPLPRCMPTTFRWDIHVVLDELQRWRHEADAVVEGWGFGQAVRDTVVLGVSELLTNVVRHAGDPQCVLELRKTGSVVSVRVTDRSPTVPVITKPDWEATSGRGLWMLQAMVGTLRWATLPRSCGPPAKVVSFEVAGQPRQSSTAYRIESVAYLKTPDREGSRLLTLGDWYDEDPAIALRQLVARMGEVACDLAPVDPPSADSLHTWITTTTSSTEALDRLRGGDVVSCVVEGGEAVYEFLVRPVPMTTTPAKVVSSCV